MVEHRLFHRRGGVFPGNPCSANAWNSLHISADVKIFATDVDQNAIATAQKGIYSESLLENMDQAMLDQYFEHTSGGYLVGEKSVK